MTLDECKDVARRVAMGFPPSDFGSTRAINAFGETLRAEILKERQACYAIASGAANHFGTMAEGCDDVEVMDRWLAGEHAGRQIAMKIAEREVNPSK